MFSVMLSSDSAGDSWILHCGLGAHRLLFDRIDSFFFRALCGDCREWVVSFSHFPNGILFSVFLEVCVTFFPVTPISEAMPDPIKTI